MADGERKSYTPLAAGASTAALGYLLSRYGAGITDIPTNLMFAGAGGAAGYLGGKAYDEGVTEQTADKNAVKANIAEAQQDPMTAKHLVYDLAGGTAGAAVADKLGHKVGQGLANIPLGNKAGAVDEAIAKAREGTVARGIYDVDSPKTTTPTTSSINAAGQEALKGLNPADEIHSGLARTAVTLKSGTKGINTGLRLGRWGAGSVAGTGLVELIRHLSAKSAIQTGEENLQGIK